MAYYFRLNGLQFRMIFPLCYQENFYLYLKTQVENQVCVADTVPALQMTVSRRTARWSLRPQNAPILFIYNLPVGISN